MLFERRSLVSLLKDIRQSRLTCVKLMEECIDRSIKTKKLNHFTYQDHKAMLKSAFEADDHYKIGMQKPLEGIPIGLKDNIDSTDSPTTGGSPSLKGHKSKFDCMLWQRLKINGAISGGKLNMHEYAYGTTTDNAEYGPCYSALDHERTAGGSSGGSGGVVGTGTLPIALGTDTGGSIRIPATCNGVVGYRPTVNRWHADFGIHMSLIRDTVGPLAVCMEDVSYLDELVTEQKPLSIPTPNHVRIGIPNARYYDDLDPEVQRVAQRAINNLKRAGIQLVEGDGVLENFTTLEGFEIITHEMPGLLQEYLHKHGIQTGVEEAINQVTSPDVKILLQNLLTTKISEKEFYEIFHIKRRNYRKNYYSYFERKKLDAIFYPTMPNLPPKFSELEGPQLLWTHNGVKQPYIIKSIQNTDPSSLLNFPSISLPAKKIDEGIPVNMELMSPTGEDRRLIAIASLIEKHIL